MLWHQALVDRSDQNGVFMPEISSHSSFSQHIGLHSWAHRGYCIMAVAQHQASHLDAGPRLLIDSALLMILYAHGF